MRSTSLTWVCETAQARNNSALYSGSVIGGLEANGTLTLANSIFESYANNAGGTVGWRLASNWPLPSPTPPLHHTRSTHTHPMQAPRSDTLHRPSCAPTTFFSFPAWCVQLSCDMIASLVVDDVHFIADNGPSIGAIKVGSGGGDASHTHFFTTTWAPGQCGHVVVMRHRLRPRTNVGGQQLPCLGNSTTRDDKFERRRRSVDLMPDRLYGGWAALPGGQNSPPKWRSFEDNPFFTLHTHLLAWHAVSTGIMAGEGRGQGHFVSIIEVRWPSH